MNVFLLSVVFGSAITYNQLTMKKRGIRFLITVNKKLELFSELISCNYAINLTSYDSQLNTFCGTGTDHHVYDRILEYGGIKEKIINYYLGSETFSPLIISDSFDLVWIACFEGNNSVISNVHILGPVYISEHSIKSLQDKLDTFDIPLNLRSLMLRKLKDIPVIISSLFFQYAIMLHYCIREEKITTRDLQYLSNVEIFSNKAEIERLEEYDTDKNHTGIWQAEQTFLSMIENGDLNYKDVYNRIATLSRGVKIKSSTPINQAKYSIITFITLCSRAAIRGGLFSGTAYTMSDYYTQSVEDATSISDLGIISRQMFEDYVQRVHKIKNMNHVSTPIKNAQSYIQTNIQEKINLKEMARHLGYTEYYLSQKFKSEVGISFNDYVQLEKIEKAKMMLKTTSLTIEEISASLAFSSRSHFSTVFKKRVKVTPSLYRKEHLRQ